MVGVGGMEPTAQSIESQNLQTRLPSSSARNRLSQLFWPSSASPEEVAVVKKSDIISPPSALPNELRGSLRFSTLSQEQRKAFIGLGIEGGELETDFNQLLVRSQLLRGLLGG